MFVVLQGTAWTIYSATVLLGFYCVYVGFDTLTAPALGMITSVGIGSLLSQFLLVVSLSYFDYESVMGIRRQSSTADLLAADKAKKGKGLWNRSKQMFLNHRALLTVAFFFMLPIIILGMYLSPFYLFGIDGWKVWLLFLLGYAYTYYGSPHIHGSRSWNMLRYHPVSHCVCALFRIDDTLSLSVSLSCSIKF